MLTVACNKECRHTWKQDLDRAVKNDLGYWFDCPVCGSTKLVTSKENVMPNVIVVDFKNKTNTKVKKKNEAEKAAIKESNERVKKAYKLKKGSEA